MYELQLVTVSHDITVEVVYLIMGLISMYSSPAIVTPGTEQLFASDMITELIHTVLLPPCSCEHLSCMNTQGANTMIRLCTGIPIISSSITYHSDKGGHFVEKWLITKQ